MTKPTREKENLKKKPLTSYNPAQLGLTGAEDEVLKIITSRQRRGLIIKSSDVAKARGNERSYTYRVIQALIGKGLVEQYRQGHYRLASDIQQP